MKKIILPRGKGKTTELIKLSADTQKYILVADRNRVREIIFKALLFVNKDY